MESNICMGALLTAMYKQVYVCVDMHLCMCVYMYIYVCVCVCSWQGGDFGQNRRIFQTMFHAIYLQEMSWVWHYTNELGNLPSMAIVDRQSKGGLSSADLEGALMCWHLLFPNRSNSVPLAGPWFPGPSLCYPRARKLCLGEASHSVSLSDRDVDTHWILSSALVTGTTKCLCEKWGPLRVTSVRNGICGSLLETLSSPFKWRLTNPSNKPPSLVSPGTFSNTGALRFSDNHRAE